MTENGDVKRLAVRTALVTVGILATLVFGIITLASGDWVPGVTIVVASLVALGAQIPVIRRLCSDPAAPSATTRNPTGHPR